jgi:hypothetical protein
LSSLSASTAAANDVSRQHASADQDGAQQLHDGEVILRGLAAHGVPDLTPVDVRRPQRLIKQPLDAPPLLLWRGTTPGNRYVGVRIGRERNSARTAWMARSEYRAAPRHCRLLDGSAVRMITGLGMRDEAGGCGWCSEGPGRRDVTGLPPSGDISGEDKIQTNQGRQQMLIRL